LMRGESDGDLSTPVCSQKGKPKGKFDLMGDPFRRDDVASSLQKCECDLSYRMDKGRRTVVIMYPKSPSKGRRKTSKEGAELLLIN
jgi:hypothetical protein